MIKCPNCGKIVEEKKFCVNCGYAFSTGINHAPVQSAPVQNTPVHTGQVNTVVEAVGTEEAVKKSRKKKFPLFFAGAVLGGALSVAGFFVLNSGLLKNQKQVAKVEENGYDTPEAAMTAYLEAMKHGDAEGMMATYAIDSYAENVDFLKNLKSLRSYYISTYPIVPVEDVYTEGLVRAQARASSYNLLLWQYFELTDPKDLEGKSIRNDLNMQPVHLRKDFGRYVDSLTDDDWMKELSSLTYGDILEMSEMENILPEIAFSESSQQMLESWKEKDGYEEIVPLAAEVEFRGKEYYVTADAVCYDGRWYLKNTGGFLSTMMSAQFGWVER